MWSVMVRQGRQLLGRGFSTHSPCQWEITAAQQGLICTEKVVKKTIKLAGLNIHADVLFSCVIIVAA